MKDSFRTSVRILSLALISTLTLALAACGGGGGGGASGTGSTGSTGNSSGNGSTNQVVETCDGGNSNEANAVAPCMTVTGLASGASVTVSDGTDSLTETSDGTYTFPAVAFVPNGNGSLIAPTVTFAVTKGSCHLDSSTSDTLDHASVFCAAYPAVNPPIPTVTTLPGVSQPTVIGTPVIVPVMFQTANGSTGNQANDVTFLQQLTASKVWGLLGQYGVGGATVEAAVTDTSPGFQVTPYSTVTAQEIDNLIQANATTWDPNLTANTVFVFFLPPNVLATYANGMIASSGLPDAAGPNGQVTVGSTTVTYAMVEDTSQNFYQTDSVIYEATELALVDAVTNPSGTDGYAWTSSDPDVWLGASIGTLGDLETQSPAQGQSTVSIGSLCTSGGQVSYSDITVGEIQPIWSQSDADAGRDPCQPELVPGQEGGGTASTLSDASTAFYGVVPETSGSATGTLNGVARTDDVVEVSPGQSVTVSLQFFSTQPLANDISISPTVVGYISGTQTSGTGTPGGTNAQPLTLPALISLSSLTNESRPDATQSNANNGDTLKVTITASSTPFSGMYVVEFAGIAKGVVPLLVTEGDTWQ